MLQHGIEIVYFLRHDLELSYKAELLDEARAKNEHWEHLEELETERYLNELERKFRAEDLEILAAEEQRLKEYFDYKHAEEEAEVKIEVLQEKMAALEEIELSAAESSRQRIAKLEAMNAEVLPLGEALANVKLREKAGSERHVRAAMALLGTLPPEAWEEGDADGAGDAAGGKKPKKRLSRCRWRRPRRRCRS